MSKSLVVNRKRNYNLPGDLRVKGNSSFLSTVTLGQEPTEAMHAATKQYADIVQNALDIKEAARVATTTAIDLDNAPIAIDGVILNVGDRILVKDTAYKSSLGETLGEATAVYNGIYKVSELIDTNEDTTEDAAVLVRSEDADEPGEVLPGMFLFVMEGNENENTGFVNTSNNPLELGTHEIVFTTFTRPEAILAGLGLYKDEFNYLNIERDAITDIILGNRTIDDTLPSIDDGQLTEVLGGLARAIKEVKGTANWKDDLGFDLSIPEQPRGIVLTDLGGGNVEVAFDLPYNTDNIDKYEIWAAAANRDNRETFKLRNIMSADALNYTDETQTRVSYIDNFDKKAIIKFKIFSVKNEIRSEAKLAQIDLTFSEVADPGNLSTVTTSDFVTVHFEKAPEEWIKSYVVKVDSKLDQANLSEADAQVIYEGFSDGLSYQIPEEDKDKFHQFWVYSVADFYDMMIEDVKLGALNGDTLSISIPEGITFTESNVTVYKMGPGDNAVTEVLTTFDNSDSADFEANDYVEFTGVMKLKTSYSTEMIGSGVADYKLDYINGTFTALGTGTMTAGFSYNIEFIYKPSESLNESFIASHDAFVKLDYAMIGEGTEVVTSLDGATEYVVDEDYEIDYELGSIKVLSTGSMADATEFLIRYAYGADQLVRGAIDVTALDTEIDLGQTNIVAGFTVVTDGEGKEYNSFYELGEGQLFTQDIDLTNYDGLGTISIA